MKTKEIRKKSEKELTKLLNESQDKLRDMRFKVAQRQLKKVSDVSVIKKDVSKILTILKEKA